jgi:hypothetical protein
VKGVCLILSGDVVALSMSWLAPAFDVQMKLLEN